jgi:hypothetical protein
MKKLLLTTAIAMAMASTVAFAHHPAEAYVDPVIYEMIDENVSDQHAALEFYDMGSVDVMGGDPDVGGDNTVGGTAVSIDTEGVGAEMSGDVEDIDAGAEARAEMNATGARR